MRRGKNCCIGIKEFFKFYRSGIHLKIVHIKQNFHYIIVDIGGKYGE